MAKRIISSRIYTNFIISYVVTLLFPLLIMSFLVLYSFVNTLKSEVEINLTNSFKKSVENFGLQMEQLQKTSLQLELNSVFRMYSIKRYPYNFIDIKNELSKYHTNSFVSDLLIYNYDDGYISSVNFAYTLSDFKQIYMPATNIESILEEFRNSAETDALYFFTKDQFINMGTQNYLMYLNKLPVYSSGHYAFVVYLIPQNSLQSVLSPAMITKDTYIFIRQPGTSQLLFSFSEDRSAETLAGIEKALYAMKDPNAHELKINKKDYSVFTFKSDKTNLEFIQLVPSNLLSKKIDNFRTTFMISTLIIIILSGFIISILMRINYRPINNLRKLIEETLSTKYTIKDQLNELEVLEYALQQYNKENNELHELVSNNNTIVQQYLLDCFLFGQAKEIDNIDVTCKLSGLDFNKRYYAIMVLKTCTTDYDNKVDSIEGLLLHNSPEDKLQYFVKKDISNKKIIVLLGSDQDSEKTIREYANNILQHIKNEYGDNTRIGIGGYVQDIFDLYKSYQEALKVLDYNYTVSKSYVSSISELSQTGETNIKYPFHLFDELKSSIHEKEAIGIEASISRILSFIKTENLTLYWAKNLCYDIVNTIFKELLITNSHSPLLNKPYIEKIYGAEMTTFEDIENTMSEIINDLTNLLDTDEGTYELKLLHQIVQYVRENYADPNFSLQSLADSIQMSPPYLSQYFKNNTNSTLSEYVTKLRMKKAKELLVKTQMSVNDIAAQVGYYSVSSFIRKFRETEDLTPGQYKKKFE